MTRAGGEVVVLFVVQTAALLFAFAAVIVPKATKGGKGKLKQFSKGTMVWKCHTYPYGCDVLYVFVERIPYKDSQPH